MSLEFKLKRAENHETSTFCSDELTDGFQEDGEAWSTQAGKERTFIHDSGDSMTAKVVDRKSLFEVTVLNQSRFSKPMDCRGQLYHEKTNKAAVGQKQRLKGNSIGLIKVSKDKDAEQHLKRNLFSIRISTLTSV